MAAIVIFPAQYGGPKWQGPGGSSILLPDLNDMDSEFQELVQELRDTHAGKSVIQAYSKRLAFQTLGRTWCWSVFERWCSSGGVRVLVFDCWCSSGGVRVRTWSSCLYHSLAHLLFNSQENQSNTGTMQP